MEPKKKEKEVFPFCCRPLHFLLEEMHKIKRKIMKISIMDLRMHDTTSDMFRYCSCGKSLEPLSRMATTRLGL